MAGQVKRLALMLPGFIPNLHYLATCLNSTEILLDDTAVWSRKSVVHRAKIRTSQGTGWINIPVRIEDKKKRIAEVRIDHRQKWTEHHLKTLFYNYKNSLYFDSYEQEIRSDFVEIAHRELILDVCLFMMGRIWKYLELDVSHLLRSGHNPDFTAYEQVYHEPGSKNYQHIVPPMQEMPFRHPVYHQHFGEFIPDCCLLDLLFQNGPRSWMILDQLVVPRPGNGMN